MNAVNLFALIVILSLIQAVLIILRLSPSISNFSWGIVFIPIWIYFFLFCLLPLPSTFEVDPSVFMLCTICFWIPLLIFFILLAIKLDCYQNANNIKYVYILIPFWIIEGIILLMSIFFIIGSIYRLSIMYICALYSKKYLKLIIYSVIN